MQRKLIQHGSLNYCTSQPCRTGRSSSKQLFRNQAMNSTFLAFPTHTLLTCCSLVWCRAVSSLATCSWWSTTSIFSMHNLAELFYCNAAAAAAACMHMGGLEQASNRCTQLPNNFVAMLPSSRWKSGTSISTVHSLAKLLFCVSPAGAAFMQVVSFLNSLI